MPPTNSPLLMGIDAGTSRVRALLFELDGTLVAEASDEPTVKCSRPGWASTEAEDLFKSCLNAIRSVVTMVDKPERVRSVAVASVGEAGVPIDAVGDAVYPIIAWYDCRTLPQANWLKQHIGEERLYKITGLNMNPIFGLCKQLWIRENDPEAFKKTVRWLNTADFLAWKLCGVPATDYSLASRTFALNIQNLEYENELLEEVGIPCNWYQPLVPSGTFLGNILPEIAKITGLSSDCKVSSGGHDHLVGALIAGATNQGTLINSMGTAEAVTLFLDKPIYDKAVGSHGYVQGVIVADRPYYYHLGGLFTSGGAVQWFHRLTKQRYSHEELIKDAWGLPPGANGVLFLPQMRVGSPPNPAEMSRGAFIGLGTDTDHTVLYRSMLEGMAFDVKMIVEGISQLKKAPEIENIHCFGGESRNDLLMKIKASVLNRALTKMDMPETVSLGAAILGGIGAGIFTNLQEAINGLRFNTYEILPQSEWVEHYQKFYDDVYSDAWKQIRPLQEKLLKACPPNDNDS